jgi:hypothetical protein
MALVQTKDIIERDGQAYEVVIADSNIFVIGAYSFDEEEACYTTSYENLEAYSNDESVNTLARLGFVKK